MNFRTQRVYGCPDERAAQLSAMQMSATGVRLVFKAVSPQLAERNLAKLVAAVS